MDYSKEIIPYTSVDYYRESLKLNEATIQHNKLQTDQASQTHDNVIFLYIAVGEALLEINGQSFPFRQGQLVILMSYHIFSIKKCTTTLCEYYQCEFSMALLLLSNTSKLTYHESLVELDKDVPIVTLSLAEQTEMEQLCQKLASPESEELTFANDLRILSAMTSVLYIFLQGLTRRRQLDSEPMNLPWSILQYLHFHHQKQLTIKNLAAHFHLNTQDINVHLKKLTGLSFAQNLNRVRILNATALLEFNMLSVNQIGRIVGFQTDAYFYKEFKKVHQSTPQQYRDSFSPKQKKRINDDSYDIYICIYENYRSKLTVSSIAKELSLTSKRVSQLVLDNFQMSVNELIGNIRVCHAKGLILSTPLTLNQIAEQVGFRDSKQFRHYFKYFYQQIPSDYRNKYG